MTSRVFLCWTVWLDSRFAASFAVQGCQQPRYEILLHVLLLHFHFVPVFIFL